MVSECSTPPRHRSRQAKEKRDALSLAAETCHAALQQSVKICNAYLVKRRSFPDSDVSRVTNDEGDFIES